MKKAEFKAANGDELILTPSPINYENLSKEFPDSKFEIIGTINAANEIDFEDNIQESWIEKHFYPFGDNSFCGYENYYNKKGFQVLDTIKESFISLLKSKIEKEWKYNENPYISKTHRMVVSSEITDWQLAEELTRPEKLLLIKKIK